MRSIVYHPKVPAEVRKIIQHYEEVSPQLADDFWAELVTAIDYAAQYPERHHFDPSGRRRSNLTRFPYHFLFRTFPDTIRVTVVRHDSRRSTLGNRRK